MADASKLKRKNSLGSPPPEAEASPNLHEPEIPPASSSLNLGQAAREVGKSRSVIYNALKSGRLSGKYNDKGEWDIDLDELLRVFSPQDLQENSPELEGTYKNALLEFLREQLHDAKELANHAREREDQALERERESREREARLLLLLAIEQEARRSLEQKLLTAPTPALLAARPRPVQWVLLGVLLTGVSGIGAYLLNENYQTTVEAVLSRILAPTEVATVAEPAVVSVVNSAAPQVTSAEIAPLPSQPLPHEEAKTAVVDLPSLSPPPAPSPPPAEVETVNAPAAPVTVNAPEVPVLVATPAPPVQRPQQPRPNGEPARQSWWWWWW